MEDTGGTADVAGQRERFNVKTTTTNNKFVDGTAVPSLFNGLLGLHTGWQVAVVDTKINFASSILTECTYSQGLFFHKKMVSGKRESELATFDENRRAVGMLYPMRDKN